MAYYVKRKSQSIKLLFGKKWCRFSNMKVLWTTISTYWHCWARRGVRRQGDSSRSFSMLLAKVLHITDDWKQWKSSFIRHDMQSIIPEILHPIKFMSPLCLCLYGDDVITSDTLIKTFRQFLATEDREALEKCLGDDFEPNDEDVSDLLTSFKCFKAPSKNNIEAIIIKLTHQELVQRPRYVINYWNPIL